MHFHKQNAAAALVIALQLYNETKQIALFDYISTHF